MKRHAAVSGVLAAVLGAAALVSGGAASVRAAAGEQLYYGVTSKGLQVTLPVRGDRIVTEGLRSYLLYRIARSDIVEFHPQGSGFVFRNRKLVWHRHVNRGNVFDVTFRATLSADGSTMTGSYREHNYVYGHWVDTGTIRFSARRWAGEQGVEWTGKAATGAPLSLLVGYRLVPGHVILNGKRTREPSFELTAPAVTVPLTCTDAAGARAVVPVTLPALRGALSGRIDYPAFATGLRSAAGEPARASGTTPQGTAVDAQLSIEKLSWRGGGLVATGALAASAGSCDPLSTTFTLHPR